MPLDNTRKCKCGCGKDFVPTRDWQKFYPGHRQKYWKEIYAGKRELHDRLEKIEEKLGISK